MATKNEKDLWRQTPPCPISEKQIKDTLQNLNIEPAPTICRAILKAAQDYVIKREWQNDKNKFPSQSKTKRELNNLLDAGNTYLSFLKNLHYVSELELICNIDPGMIANAIVNLEKLNAATTKAIELLQKQSILAVGRPSQIARDTFIRDMAKIYCSATGKRPGKPYLNSDATKYSGPFFNYINNFLTVIDGVKTHNATLRFAVNDALTFFNKDFPAHAAKKPSEKK